ncbi:hypothetical protein [Limnoglobus roseus]|uniref:Uncharacterized protein n=1 Tax=Limnoglobus roseus TaxID=2598579 RepID=A0A5C1AL45_9BACT|nr:hypothetical protein [Limnoglobus roseus]QEL17618.1 hypothetical protein PX52LOC_04616 [Limnoglobus roseus]
MNQDRRSVITALGLALPFGSPARASGPAGPAPWLSLRSFEDAVRDAFHGGAIGCRRIAVGHSAAVEAGLQGCTNDRLFAGFPAGRLRIVGGGSQPGPIVSGVRLYVTTVDVRVTTGPTAGRPLDFASLPPAPILVADYPSGRSECPSTAPPSVKTYPAKSQV